MAPKDNRRKLTLGPSDVLAQNDDMKEKGDRRKSRAFTANLGSPLKAEPTEPVNLSRRRSVAPHTMKRTLTNTQISELYSDVIRLSTENKITAKNTWALNLIDHIDDVIHNAGEQTNFGVASATIDASVKIYSSRVDSVHTEAFKVLGGLSRTELRAPSSLDDDDEDGGGPKSPTKREAEREKSRPKIGGLDTLVAEANLESIKVKKFDLEFAADPLFTKTSEAFNGGVNASGLLLNHLSVYDGCHLIFDSSDLLVSNTASVEEEDSPVELNGLLENVELDRRLCPTYAGFHGWASPADDAPLTSAVEEDPIEEEDLADNMNYDNFQGPPEFDDDSVPFDEELPRHSPHPSPKGKGAKFDEANPNPASVIVTAGNQYEFISPSFAKNWMGQSHWGNQAKIAPVTKAKAKGRGAKKEALFVDFDKPLSKAELDALFAPPKQATTTANTKAKKASETTLPPDVHYDPEQLLRLFQKPDWKIVPGRRVFTPNLLDQDAGGGHWYNLDNAAPQEFAANDPLDFEPAPLDDRWEDEDASSKANPVNTNFRVTAHLVDEPEKVAKQTIGFATRAKQVDVKLLKNQIWDVLCETDAKTLKKKPKSKEKEKEERTMEKETTFTQMLSDLSQSAPKQTLRDVSVSYCLICLLHLANENDLVITGTSQLDELRIAPAN